MDSIPFRPSVERRFAPVLLLLQSPFARTVSGAVPHRETGAIHGSFQTGRGVVVQVLLRWPVDPGIDQINLEDRGEGRRNAETARARTGLSQPSAKTGKSHPSVAGYGGRISGGLQTAFS